VNHFIELQKDLKKAQRQIELLCEGFGVGMEPTWAFLVNKVLVAIKDWEEEGEITIPTQLTIPNVFYAVNAVTATNLPLPNILFHQFQVKFINIVKNIVIPALRAYKKENPNIDLVTLARPLLDVRISAKD